MGCTLPNNRFKMLSTRSIAKSLLLLLITTFSNNGFAACNASDIPLGSGIVSTGIIIDKTSKNQFANGSGGTDGRFIYEFDSNGLNARCGRHADGTWWLAPAAGQSTVSLNAIRSNTSLIRAEDNPDPASRGFLNNAEDYGRFDSSLNIVPSLPTSYPLNTDSVTSIFAAIQRNNTCGTSSIENECIEYADFLTVYKTPPANGGKNTIRPTLFGNQKTVYTWADFDLSRIPSFNEAQWDYDNDEVLDLVSKWTATTEAFSLPLCDSALTDCGFISEGGRAYRSHAVIDDYAAGGLQNRVLSYLLNSTSDVINDTEDKALLAAIIAYGVDIITLIGQPPANERYAFDSGAGQFMNAANLSYFTAALSPRNGFLWNTMQTNVLAMVESSEVSGPQEMQQVYDRGFGAVWGDGNPVFSELSTRRYWAEMRSGLAHENSDNWYVFRTSNAGTTFEVKDSATGRVVPTSCNIRDDGSFCRDSTVIVGDQLLYLFDYDTDGSNLILVDAVSAGTLIQVSPITERYQGWIGGQRSAGDPHGQIDSPPGVPGSGYFQVSNGPRIEWAGIALAIPELCEVINYPSLFQFVERYLTSGLQMQNDSCAPPSDADVANSCDVFKSKDCLDYGLVNDGTARWGPDPRDPKACIENNKVLNRNANGTWTETNEARGDNGRFTRFHGLKHSRLAQTFSAEYLAFKGSRSCSPENDQPNMPTTHDTDDLLLMIPAIIATKKKMPLNTKLVNPAAK